jgi:hypothetical protein
LLHNEGAINASHKHAAFNLKQMTQVERIPRKYFEAVCNLLEEIFNCFAVEHSQTRVFFLGSIGHSQLVVFDQAKHI